MNVAEIRDDLPRSPEASDFPQALAAMERVEETLQEVESQAQWSVGDAVLQDIPIQPVGVKDGSLLGIKRLAVLAESRGHRRYNVTYLRRLRSVSARFPDVRRRTSYPWTIHEEAGDPEILDEIISRAEAEAVPVTFRYAREKKHQINGERTRAASTSDLGATTQVGHNVIAMPLLRKKRPSWKEVAEELQEEREANQRLEEDIDRLQQLTLMEAAAKFEAGKARELARESLSSTPVMAKAIAEQDDIIDAEVSDGSQQNAGSDRTNPQDWITDKLRQMVQSKTGRRRMVGVGVSIAVNELVDNFDEVVTRHHLSDYEEREVAQRLLQEILQRKAFNEGRGA